ncbi:MAG TPA: hypothetical protein PKO09_06195 [Anaerolineae bacterium]|nr:hypothetical protein [Anaerolineae bacterium]
MEVLTTPDCPYERRIEYARASLWLPWYAVGMVARIQGEVPPERLRFVLSKLQCLHPAPASRVRMEADGSAWLTTQDVGEYPLEVRRRTDSRQWVEILLEQERVPFAFDRGPVARFFLLRGSGCSEVGIVAPHVVCDGYSTAHLVYDLVALLNDPGREVASPSPPAAVTWQTMPHAAHDALLLRGLVGVANRALRGGRMLLDQEAYTEAHRRYWERRQVGVMTFGLDIEETCRLIARCKQHGVSVTATLVAAFLLAETAVRRKDRAARRHLTLAVSVRDRMAERPGTAVGFYTSSVDLTLRTGLRSRFWEVAREGQARIYKAVGKRSQILRPLVMEGLDPRIADRLVADIARGDWHGVMAHFYRFLRARAYARSLDLSNIGRVEPPDLGSPFRLEALLPWPPLMPGGGITLNTMTAAGKMAGTCKFRREVLDDAAAARILDRALEYLRDVPEAGPAGAQSGALRSGWRHEPSPHARGSARVEQNSARVLQPD